MTTISSSPDDYALRQRIADLERALRRAERQLRLAKQGILCVGDLEIDQFARIVRHHGEPLPLRPKEYHLLALLARHVGDVVPKPEISRSMYGRETPSKRAVLAAHLSRLRIVLAATTVVIVTERAEGYRLIVANRVLS